MYNLFKNEKLLKEKESAEKLKEHAKTSEKKRKSIIIKLIFF